MTQHRRTFAVSVAVLVALATASLAACGGSSGKTSKATRSAVDGKVTIVAKDISFDISEIKTAPGLLTVTLDNQGALQHDFKIDKTSLLIKANGGKSGTGSVTLATGTYDFECSVPGHKSAGMKGTVVVK